MWEIQAQQNYLPRPLPLAQELRKKNFTPRENYEKRTLPRYAAIARHSNVIKHTCKDRVLYCTFGEKKKWCTFQKQRWRSAQKTVRFLMYCTWRRKCFNSSERCSFWQIYCIILMVLTSESEEPIAKSSHVT